MDEAIRKLIYFQMQYYARKLGAQYRILPGVQDLYKHPRFKTDLYLTHCAVRFGTTVGLIAAYIEKINELQVVLNDLNRHQKNSSHRLRSGI